MITEDPRSVVVSALRIKQPIGDIYVGSIPAKVLVEITDFDIRSLVSERGIDSYMGIQRELDPKRVKEIAQYVRGPDATFPTAVVLAVPERCVAIESPCEADDRFVVMTLSNYVRPDAEAQQPESDEGIDPNEETVLYRSIAKVIDGQHRIKGLEGYSGPDFDINVSIFIDIDIADQASVFSTVNLAQTKVNRSLVYDLFDFSQSKSPERTCHSVVVALESTEGSPFYRKIKRLGKATPGRYSETLSQATVVSGILQYICKDKIQIISDRQIGRRGGTFPAAAPGDAKKLVLRPFLVEDRDVDLTNLIWNYFDAVKNTWPEAWKSNGTGMILNRTNGYDGLMKFFRHAYLHFAAPGEMVEADQFSKLFSLVKLKDDDFNPQNFVPGSSGAAALNRVLREQTGLL